MGEVDGVSGRGGGFSGWALGGAGSPAWRHPLSPRGATAGVLGLRAKKMDSAESKTLLTLNLIL